MNAAFLQDKAVVMSFCRGQRRSEGVEYKYWYNNLDYGTFLMFCGNNAMQTVGNDTYIIIKELRKNLEKLGL